MLPNGGLFVFAQTGKVKNCLQGAFKLSENIRIGAVTGTLRNFRVGERVRFFPEGFHTGYSLCFLGKRILLRQMQGSLNALIKAAGILPCLAQAVVELCHGVKHVVS